MSRIWKQYVVDVRERADAEIEIGPKSDRRTVIVLVTAILSLWLIRFAGDALRFGWLTSSLSAVGLDAVGDRLSFALDGSPSDHFNQRLYWAVWRILGYVLLPVFVIRSLLHERIRDFGLRARGTWTYGRIYLLLLSVIAPVVLVVSFNSAFQAKYPLYEVANGEALWPRFWIFELFYALQFVSLEFFFRGFLIHGLAPRFGYMSVYIMMVPYMMIHFQKPALEALGSILAGFALGTLALASRSIWWGAFAHVSVALSMDLLALWHRGIFGD